MKIEHDRPATIADPHDTAADANGNAVDVNADAPQRPPPSRRARRAGRPWTYGVCWLLVAVPLTLAALWPRASFALDVGAPGDRLFLANVHGDERLAEYSYRWTGWRDQPALLTVPGWGAVGRARVTLRAQALPDQGATDLQLQSEGTTVGTLRIDGAMAARTVEIALPAAAGADLVLALAAPTRRVAGDDRPLGVKIDSIQLTPLTQDDASFWRTLWPHLGLALALVAALLLLLGGAAGRLALAGRAGATLAVPLALVLALPWALALLPYALWAAFALAALRWRRVLLRGLIAIWAALDRPRLSNRLVAGGIALYAAIMLPYLLAVPWINHADYADNAVVARNLVRGNGFSIDYVAQFYTEWATLRHPAETWPPLQPLLLAVAFALFGVSVGVAKLPNLIVMIGLLWLVYRIGRWLWSPRVGVIAALLLMLHPDFFEGVVYPLNDMVFTLLALGCVALFVYVADPEAPSAAATSRWRRWRPWIALGVLGGLLLLAKPSGAIVLAGGAGWVLWQAWRGGRLRPVVRGGMLAAALAVAVYSPWLVRNQLTFGQPFYSTESYDAFILEYRDWENIYQVYAGQQPLPHRSLLVRYGVDAVSAKIGAQFRKAWRDLAQGNIVPTLQLPLILVAALIARERRQRAALAVLGGAVGAYLLFIAVYWHYERRYALFLVPWGALFGAAGLWWLHDWLAEARGRALAGLAALVLLGAIVVPQGKTLADDRVASLRTPNPVVVAEWIRDNTPGNAVVMTRNPWELSFHGERLSVMIPTNDLPTIRAIAAKYGATYLQLDHLTEQKLRRPALGPLYDGPDEWQGFRKVYDRRNDDGEGLLVYTFPK